MSKSIREADMFQTSAGARDGDRRREVQAASPKQSSPA